MYYSELDPLHKVTYKSEPLFVAKGERRRRLHKAILRYHDPAGWPMIRQALLELGLARLIGTGPQHLVPPEERQGRSAKPTGGRLALTRHTDMTRQREPHGQRSRTSTAAAPAKKEPAKKEPAKKEPAKKEQGNKKPNSPSSRGSSQGANGRSSPRKPPR